MKHKWKLVMALGLSIIVMAAFTIEPIVAMAKLSPKVSSFEANISTTFDYKSKFVQVGDSSMHYVEEGSGDAILLVHGNPTSSYLWRNVIPHLSSQGRVIALDLMGMGKSDKPADALRFADHAAYLDRFIQTLALTNLTLVLHDWGGALGLDYAARHSANVQQIVVLEAVIRPTSWSKVNFMEEYLFKRLRDPEQGLKLLGEQNLFVERLLPMMTGRELAPAEMTAYRTPFRTTLSRAPVVQWPKEIPIDGVPADNAARIGANFAALQDSEVPVLVLHGEPGLIFNQKFLKELSQDLPRAQQISVGPGLHYLQETQPAAIGAAISKWLKASR